MGTSRLKVLGRLMALYRRAEHADGIALDRSRRSLQDIETQMGERRSLAARLSIAGQDALSSGDREEWLLSQSQIRLCEWDSQSLEQLRQQRLGAMRDAAAAFQQSRLQLEQVKSVLETVRSQVARERERAEQYLTDDRHLARLRWRQGEVDKREDKHANFDDRDKEPSLPCEDTSSMNPS